MRLNTVKKKKRTRSPYTKKKKKKKKKPNIYSVVSFFFLGQKEKNTKYIKEIEKQIVHTFIYRQVVHIINH